IGGTALVVDSGVQIRTPRRFQPTVRFLPHTSLWHGVRHGKTVRGSERRNMIVEPDVDPFLGLSDVLRVGGQPLPECEATLSGPRREFADLRPRPFGVDVVRSYRRHPAPVVDPGPQQQLVFVPYEVRWCLDAYPRRQ